MYRFLLTPRWLGILALTLMVAAGMVLLGNWQLNRYETRSAINDRIDATATVAPVPISEVLPSVTGPAGVAGPPPPAVTTWTRVTAIGQYDSDNVILVRGRTAEGKVGFEILTPLRLDDGSAVLVSRGWVPPPAGDATAQPQVPPAPSGEVTVVGRVRPSESRTDAISRRDGRIETRRISLPGLAEQLPYPIHGAYLLLDEQTPPADPLFSALPIRYENNWQNGGYVVQWWLFALMALIGFGWLARREAQELSGRGGKVVDLAAEPVPTSPPSP